MNCLRFFAEPTQQNWMRSAMISRSPTQNPVSRPHSNGCWILRWWISLHRSWTSEVMLQWPKSPAQRSTEHLAKWRNSHFIIVLSDPVISLQWPKKKRIQIYSNGMRCWNSFHQRTTTEFWPKQNLKARQEFLRVILGLASQTFSDHGAKWEVLRRHRFPTWPFCILVIQIDCEKCLNFCWGMMAAEAEWDTYYS